MGDMQYDITGLTPRHQAQFLRVLSLGGIRGGAPDDPPPPPPVPAPPTPPTPPEPPAPPRTFTQDEVDKIGTREKSEGKRHAMREFAEAHGMTPEEVEAAITAQQAAAEADKTEGQKAVAQAERDKQAKLTAEAALAQEKFDRRVERMLLVEGVPIEDLERVRRLVTVDDHEADDATILADITTMKTAWPTLFEEKAPTPPPPGTPPAPPHSDPGRPPAPPAPTGSSEQQARDLLHKRHPRLVKD